MSKELTTDVTSKDLAGLLALGKKGEKQDDLPRDQTEEQALQDMLRTHITLDRMVSTSVSVVLGQPREELLPYVGRTVGEVLMAEHTDVAARKTLKDYVRALANRGASEEVEAAAKIAYYAAIAGALVFHGKKITQFSYEKLEENFTALLRKAWIPQGLKDVFIRAREACQIVIARTRSNGA